MNQFLNALSRFLWWITLGPWRDKRTAARRRANYDFLKAKISERHFAGFAGLVVDFPEQKLDKVDFAAFPSPMYYFVKNKDMKWVVFWDRGRMTREIGTGAPLKEGELAIPDPVGRTKPSSTLETVDEQIPLVIQAQASNEPPETV